MNIFDLIFTLLLLILVGMVGFILMRHFSQWINSHNARFHRHAIPSQSSLLSTATSAPTRHHTVRCFYRTKDRQADYAFSFEEQPDGNWKAYIESQPDYRGRESDAHTTHRLSDGGRRYICWTTALGSLGQAKQVAALWADATQGYIRTGKKF
jgi:hypothetical protein